MDKNWDSSETWYSSCVGKDGHYYHQSVIFPNLKRLLGKFQSILDLGCGQGVLARFLPNSEYVGIDSSKALLQSAKKLSKEKTFLLADVTEKLPLEKTDFDRAIFLLSLQNIENGESAIQNAAHHLKPKAKLIIVLNHPCFRIPRQSSWGIDEKMKLQYRRVNSYMSAHCIPILTTPSKGARSEKTHSYHHPLSTYSKWLQKSFQIEGIEEWCSDKKSQGAKAKMEDRARKEIPLFLTILAEKR